MKKALFVLTMAFICSWIFAQEKPDTTKYIYCQLVDHVKKRFISTDVAIDFGTSARIKNFDSYKTPSGNPVTFDTFIDGMNYMSEKGWEFVQAYTIMTIGAGTGTASLYWILRKPK